MYSVCSVVPPDFSYRQGIRIRAAKNRGPSRDPGVVANANSGFAQYFTLQPYGSDVALATGLPALTAASAEET